MNQPANRHGIPLPLQYVCVLFVTLCLVALCFDAIFIGVIILLIWLFIPALLVAVISFFRSLGFDTRNKRILVILNILNVLIFIFAFFNPANRQMTEKMEEHYIENSDKMEHIYSTLYDKLEPWCYVDIEFEHGKVSRFDFSDGLNDIERNWDPGDEKVDTLLRESRLDRATLDWLKKELQAIGCHSIAMKAVPDGWYDIGYRRIGLGEYFYRIYHKPLSAEEIERINHSSSEILYSPTVVFRYGSGAIGSDNIEGKDEYMKKKSTAPNP